MKYRSPTCIRHRDSKLGSSIKVWAGPVKLNRGAPLASKSTRVSGEVAAGLATLRTPQL